MAVPWLRVLDSVLGVADLALGRGRSSALTAAERQARAESGPEARLVGVMVAALKEAFNRDHERLELEREQMEAARQNAERALRLELLRQAGDREIARLRLVAGVAVASWLGTLLLSARLVAGGVPGRTALGIGWILLLGAVATCFAAERRLTRMLSDGMDQKAIHPVGSGDAGAAAPWLVVAGLATIAIGVVIL